MRLPGNFSAELVGNAVGLDSKVHTINVTTQQPGPRLLLGEGPEIWNCFLIFLEPGL